MDDFIWSNDYVTNLIEELQDENEVLKRILEDCEDTFNEWKLEDEEMYECMLELTKEQIKLLDRLNN